MDDMYIGKFLDNRYEILEKIGSGGMAVVYKARCHRLNRFVAVKILKSDLAQDPDLRRRFHAESQAVAMLSHPNIVSVYDVNHSDNIDYIVMELIEGITLKQYINRKGILNWKEALHFTTQIVKALEHAHSRGIIHRDIKPHNIMILKDGNVKVADFGIARLLTTQNTLTQETLGSVHYISPEQAKGGQVDARSDLYSVGVVMYEMLTSRLPFEGDSPVSIAIQHISSIPLMPREINPDIPIGLEEITMHAMDPNLDTRYPSATALLADLEEFRKNPSVTFNYSAIPVIVDDLDSTRPIPSGAISNVKSEHVVKKQNGNSISRNRVSEESYKKNRKKAGKTTTLVGIFCIIVFLIAIVWFMWNYALKGWLSPEQEDRIDVPNFVGQMVDNVITNSDYTMYYNFKTEYVESDKYAEGYIISQDPAANRSVTVSETGIDVTLTVSSGQETILMPNVMNIDYRDAKNKLEQLGLDLEIYVDYAPSDKYTEGYVMEQFPAENEVLISGMSVYITYSTGPEIETVKVPDLTGYTEAQAISKLQSCGLTYNVLHEYDDTAPEGKVFFQDYDPNEEVPKNTEVTFSVSLGPEITVIEPPIENNPPTDPTDPNSGSGGEGSGGNVGGTTDPTDPGDEELGNGEAIEPHG
ncbi:MAG: Stk1 family PASTA domain-containing Ser/Thr kinase [Oscillospiraceae bacterium]